jgi:ribonuclease G
MTRPCPTCAGEAVVPSLDTLAIEVERRLRRVAESSPSEAFLIEVHPRAAAALLADEGSRLRQLESLTSKSFNLEGVAHLALDAVQVAAEGTREVIERAALPVALGSEIEVHIDEVHAYNRRDGVGRLDGYPVCVAGAAGLVGHHVRVVVDEVSRYFALAHLAETADK